MKPANKLQTCGLLEVRKGEKEHTTAQLYQDDPDQLCSFQKAQFLTMSQGSPS